MLFASRGLLRPSRPWRHCRLHGLCALRALRAFRALFTLCALRALCAFRASRFICVLGKFCASCSFVPFSRASHAWLLSWTSRCARFATARASRPSHSRTRFLLVPLAPLVPFRPLRPSPACRASCASHAGCTLGHEVGSASVECLLAAGVRSCIRIPAVLQSQGGFG